MVTSKTCEVSKNFPIFKLIDRFFGFNFAMKYVMIKLLRLVRLYAWYACTLAVGTLKMAPRNLNYLFNLQGKNRKFSLSDN